MVSGRKWGSYGGIDPMVAEETIWIIRIETGIELDNLRKSIKEKGRVLSKE